MSLENVAIPEGNYVVAVSGGVDSVVLLHLLARSSRSLIVAHVDHGIRLDSASDAEFVRKLAQDYNLQFESVRFELGPGASEAEARAARYSFLFEVCKKYDAKLITAHHQDDLIETAIINILRGTGIYGLNSLADSNELRRPLLKHPKKEILRYANEHNLSWREDYTNTDTRYLRNYIRTNLAPKIEPKKQNLLKYINETAGLSAQIDRELEEILKSTRTSEGLKRAKILELSFSETCYLFRKVLAEMQLAEISRATVERISMAAKVLPIGKEIPINGRYQLVSLKKYVKIIPKVTS